MAEQKTSISELTAATTVATTDLLFISQGSGSSWTSKKATVSQLPFATSTHTHGNMQSGGTLQTTDVAIASGDKLVVTDASNSSKVARTSLAFDGSTTTQFLSKKGTFETALTAHQSLDNYYTKADLTGTTGVLTGYSLTSHTHTSYVPTSRTVAGQQLTANVTAATISTAIGLENYSLTSHTHSGYVPTSRTVAGKALTANITAAELSSAIGLGSYSLTSHTHTGYVPTSRKINGTQLTADLNVGTVTGITMNGASKGSSGVVDLGTVLTSHQSLDSCLKKTGSQTIFSCHTLTLKSDTMDSTVVPESSVQSPRIQLQDKNAYSVGFILCDRHTSGRQSLIMRARQTIDGVDSYADIGVAVNADGTKYAYCPTPASSVNNTSIATTAWVRTLMSAEGYVPKSALVSLANSVGSIPAGDSANLETVISKFNQLIAGLQALAS